jgi:type IV pilus assembly protein PilM
MNKPRSVLEKLFFDFFPPPRFLEMPSVGLDISDEVVRFADIKRRGSRFEIVSFGEQRIPKDVIEEGYVKNKPELIKVLTALRQKHNLKFVRASLPEEKSYLFRTQLPFIDESDIRGALRYKIEENVPISINDAVFDYHFIKQPKPGDTKIDVGVAVIDTKVVSSYLDVLSASGLIPLKLRIESQAIAHAVVRAEDPNAFIIIDLQETKTVFAIVSQNVIQFSSTLSISGEAIAKSVEMSLNPHADSADSQKTAETKARDAMFISLMDSSAIMRDEILKLLTYWASHGDEQYPVIKKVLLCGSFALRGVDEYLAKSLNLPVRIADVWTNILSVEESVPPITLKESLDYASALGLALPYD